ncbi:MAG: imidazole glycerol phosphate synthase glutamine amidotransferase subunit [Planctomycetota bacterium]|jgi:imidazole glycerol phosphate synthase glutamine amidotransferase subunit
MSSTQRHTPPITIVATGCANTASVVAAFKRLGRSAVLGQDRDQIAKAEYLVLPGVGSFGAIAKRLRELDLAEALVDRIRADRPTLGICLGMQVLFEASEESPESPGLGALPGRLIGYRGEQRVPHMGWNRIVPTGAGLLEEGYAYFANSYRLSDLPAGWNGATSEYGGRFTSAVERGAVLACQFHPELSGSYGESLLRRWLAAGRSIR